MHRIIDKAFLFASFAFLSACALEGGQPESQYREHSDVVSIDGTLYQRAEFRNLFGHQDLHWVVTQEVLDTGVPTAFTSEKKRNAALGVQANAIMSPDASFATTYAFLYMDINRGGGSLTVTGSIDNIGSTWNDKTSSIDTFTNDVVLYENINRTGCSLFVQRQKYISDLRDHDFCGLFTGNWNDKTSSVGIVF